MSDSCPALHTNQLVPLKKKQNKQLINQKENVVKIKSLGREFFKYYLNSKPVATM